MGRKTGFSICSRGLPGFSGSCRFSAVRPCPDGDLIHIDLYGDGGTRFQPVYVGDVAEAIIAALRAAESAGKTYELGGPEVYSSKQIMELLLQGIGRKRFLVPVPFWLFTYYAWWLEKLPAPFFSWPLLTRDQVKLLKKDNVVAPGALGLEDLGVTPSLAQAIVPAYLERFRPSRQRHLRSV